MTKVGQVLEAALQAAELSLDISEENVRAYLDNPRMLGHPLHDHGEEYLKEIARLRYDCAQIRERNK